MKTTGIRVRPVIRHVVTKWESDPENGAGGSACIAEFNHESYAEEVAEALREKYAKREYAIVEETMGEPTARVTYAYSEEDVAVRLASEEAETGKTYRVYSRIRQLAQE
jgi:hydrogenase maturation factor